MNTRGLTDTIGIIDAPIAMNLPIYKMFYYLDDCIVGGSVAAIKTMMNTQNSTL